MTHLIRHVMINDEYPFASFAVKGWNQCPPRTAALIQDHNSLSSACDHTILLLIRVYIRTLGQVMYRYQVGWMSEMD